MAAADHPADTKDAFVGGHIPRDEKEQFKHATDQLNRTQSEVIEDLIRDWLAEYTREGYQFLGPSENVHPSLLDHPDTTVDDDGMAWHKEDSSHEGGSR